jgi:hypothetical protein
MLLTYRPSAGGATLKSIVCEVDSNINSQMQVTTDATKCGSTVAPGSIDTTISGNAVVNTTPGTGEGSYADIQALMYAQTQIDWEYSNVAGDIEHSGVGWFTQLGNQNAATGTSKFTWTISVNGTPTATALTGS